MKSKGRYQLRHAAGLYWLIDMEQSGVPFRKPVLLNEMGAVIWTMLQEGREDQIADRLSGEYQVSRELVEEDVRQFRECLREQGIFV